MKARFLFLSLAAVAAAAIISVPGTLAQSQQSDTSQAPSSQPPVMQDGPDGSRKGAPGRGRPLFGKISAIQKDSLEFTTADGDKVSVKLTSSTEFRRERQPAKIGDFKVGDSVIVRSTPDSAGNSSGATALLIALMPQGFSGRGAMGGPGGMPGTLGKDYVVGEVKSIDPPKLTILRVDNVTQTLELNEETSLRRGRDSITMADIQTGDHIFARGAVVGDAFVPKGVNIIPPEQWRRMQEMSEGRGAQGVAPQNTPSPSPRQDPPERPN
jgi:hypothetical protein